MYLEEAIRSRKSVRRFLPQTVSRDVIEAMLELAARAPSGNNIQPWIVHVVTGKVKQAISKDILDAIKTEPNQHQAEYDYYPGEWFEPYQARRRAVGFELFEQLGIARADREAREKQTLRNFEFFDAPVALFISLDRRLSLGSYVDLGMFIQNLLLVAREHDLHTCAQAAFAPFHRIVRHHIPLADEHLLVCAVSLGYEDPDALENMLQTPREVVSGFSEFHGF